MDIAKYIGLFLLKNNFCYIHGLGNLVLKKKPASHDGATLHAPEYDVVLTPGGSIDDNLANFIANHEQTSISKASNSLREFSIESRTKLAAGEAIVLPGVGKFTETNGVIGFTADPQIQYTPPPIPILRTAPQAEKKPTIAASTEATTPSYRPTDREPAGADMATPAVNWTKVVVLSLLLIALAIGAYFLYNWLQKNNSGTSAVEAADSTITESMPLTPPVVEDTNTVQRLTPGAAGSGPALVVIKEYSNLTQAQRKLDVFKREGKDVSLISHDSTLHLILLPVTPGTTDTTHFVDSVGGFYGTRNARIYRP